MIFTSISFFRMGSHTHKSYLLGPQSKGFLDIQRRGRPDSGLLYNTLLYLKGVIFSFEIHDYYYLSVYGMIMIIAQ